MIRRELLCTIFLAAVISAVAQYKPVGVPRVPLGRGPFVFDTAEQHKILVTVVTKGLVHPWSVAVLPDGNMLVTERPGRIRIIRNGVLEPQAVLTPKVFSARNSGLYDIALHPKFAQNRLVYFTYSKPRDPAKMGDTDDRAIAVARGTFDGNTLTGVQDIFVGEWTTLFGGSRIAFAGDGTLFMTTSAAAGNLAQDTNSDYGKVLRLNDDGTVPKDNPFVGRAGYRPEIYSMGHRDPLGLTIDSATGAVYESENGPRGGDELNLILPGRNYGWPVVSYGRTYEGPKVSASPTKEGMEDPLVVWLPDISPSGMILYTGDKFPNWKGNIIVGGLQRGEIVGTGRLERVVFNNKMEEVRRESMLEELKQRFRDVRQAPDGSIYALTEEVDGALLHIEPTP